SPTFDLAKHARRYACKSCQIAATQTAPLPNGANRILTVGDHLRYCRREERCFPWVPPYCLESLVCRQSQDAILRFREDHQAFSAVGVIYVLQVELHGAVQQPLIRPSPPERTGKRSWLTRS